MNKIDQKMKTLVPQFESVLEDYLPDAHEPEALQMTFASDDLESFTFQSGDNSFSGPCYGLKNWGVVELGPESDCKELAIDAVEQIADGIIENLIKDMERNREGLPVYDSVDAYAAHMFGRGEG